MRLNLNINNKIILGSTPTLSLVKVLNFLAYQNIQSLVNDANWVKHTHLVTSNASSIEKLVIDMESGERGYLISGKEEFLEPYE
jgi:CHASE3 domain sensor protein